MTFSMTGQEIGDLLIQVTTWAGLTIWKLIFSNSSSQKKQKSPLKPKNTSPGNDVDSPVKRSVKKKNKARIIESDEEDESENTSSMDTSEPVEEATKKVTEDKNDKLKDVCKLEEKSTKDVGQKDEAKSQKYQTPVISLYINHVLNMGYGV